MTIRDLLALAGRLDHIRGVERDLRLRRRNGLLLTLGTTLLGVIGILTELQGEGLGAYLARVWTHTRSAFGYLGEMAGNVLSRSWSEVYVAPPQYDVLGFYFVVLGIIVYVTTRHTAFLFRQSEQPFHYTIWITRFIRAENRQENPDGIKSDDDIHHLLHLDLLEKLNQRIGRFSVLDEQHLGSDPDLATPPSHIHVDGYYAIREQGHGDAPRKFVQVIPRVRIGPPGSPSTLTQPVEIELAGTGTGALLDGSHYDYPQLVEQVYSKVASAIYGQLRVDIEAKLDLFPTDYVRAVALYREAADFLRSNTIDSYDHAIALFRKSLRFYDTSLRSLLAGLLIRVRFPRVGIEYELRHARTRIEYAKSLIFRHRVSSLTGRTRNSLFGVCDDLRQVTLRLERVHRKFHLRRWKLPRSGVDQTADLRDERVRDRQFALSALAFSNDTWVGRHVLRRPSAARFDECRELLFESHVVLGLAQASLGASSLIGPSLRRADTIAPGRGEQSALYAVTQAEAEPNLETRIQLLVRATDLDPMFEIARYLLAEYSLRQFLRRGELEQGRSLAAPVTAAFERVFQINPANIASQAHLGYLHWLLDDPETATRHFRRGADTKTIVQQTFTGELNYGLGRIAAEQGDIATSHDRYTEALSSEPALGSYSPDGGSRQGRGASYYQYMSRAVLDRYVRFRRRVEDHIRLAFASFDLDDVTNAAELESRLIADGFMKAAAHDDGGQDPAGAAERVVRTLNGLLDEADLLQHLVRLDRSARTTLSEAASGTLSRFSSRDLAGRRVRRALLDLAYADCLRACSDGEYLADPRTSRRLVGTISAGTLSGVYSHVLNDYGNACLNYFHRHGSSAELENAIQAFTAATRANPANGIAHFNLENAKLWLSTVDWNAGEIDALRERMEHLRRADELLSTPWTKVTVALARYRLDEARIDVVDRRNALRAAERTTQSARVRVAECRLQVQALEAQVNARKLRLLEQRRRAGPAPAPASAPPAGVPAGRQAGLEREVPALTAARAVGSPPAESFQADMASTADPGPAAPERDQELKQVELRLDAWSDQLQNAGQKFSEAETTLGQARADLQEAVERSELAFTHAVETAVRGSRFANIVEGGRSFRISSIDELMRVRIPGDRLEQADLEALVSVAEQLAHQADDRRRLETCVALARFVGRYWPEAFDVSLALVNAHRNLRRLNLREACEQLGAEVVFGEAAAARMKDLARAGSAPHEGLDQLIDSRPDAFFDPGDVLNPARVLRRLEEQQVRSVVANSSLLMRELDALRSRRSRSTLAARIATFLNSVIEHGLDAAQLAEAERLARRTSPLIGPVCDPRDLRGPERQNLNRRMLNEILSPWARESRVEQLNDRFRATVRAWLAEDPIHFLAIAHWAIEYLTYPEFEAVVTHALSHDPPDSDWLHEQLARLYVRNGYEDRADGKLRAAMQSFAQPAYPAHLARRLAGAQRFDEAIAVLRSAGVAGEQAGDPPEPRQSALQIELIGALNDRIMHLVDAGRWDEAIMQAEAAVTEFPNRMAETLRNVRRWYHRHLISDHYGEKWPEQAQAVTPVAMEVAPDLVPYVEGAEGSSLAPELLGLVNRMREDVRNASGVEVPGIRFRANETGLPDGTYIILLNEIPVAQGSISTARRFLPSGVSLPDGHFEPGADPVSGAAGHWVPEGWKGDPDGPRPWKVMEFPVRHLESEVRQNLAAFLGTQETHNLLAAADPERALRYEQNAADLSRLTAVLRGLVADQVPVLALRDIVAAVEDSKARESATDIIERIRRLPSVRTGLPGRDASVVYRAGPRLEDAFRRSVQRGGNAAVLAMLPETVQAVLAAVRSHVTGSRSAALIVEDPALRPHIRSLLRIEFPALHVLALPEVDLPGVQLRRAEILELPEKELVHA